MKIKRSFVKTRKGGRKNTKRMRKTRKTRKTRTTRKNGTRRCCSLRGG